MLRSIAARVPRRCAAACCLLGLSTWRIGAPSQQSATRSEDGAGLLYVPAALFLVVALKRVFDRGETGALDVKSPGGKIVPRSS